MSTHDKDGREYAKVSDVKAGTILICDGGFDCLLPYSEHEVAIDPSYDNELYIRCSIGDHGLDGQLNDKETHYIGLYLKE